MKKTAKWIAVALVACAIALAGCKVVSEPDVPDVPNTQVPVPDPIAVKSVTLNTETLWLAPGGTARLEVMVKPGNADDKTVKWSSSDTTVATVDGGTVTAVKDGTATITAQAGGKKAECVVTVRHTHSYRDGTCKVCGFQKPFMLDGTIDDNGVLTNYHGAEATVTIPDGVIGIGGGAFENCGSLKKVVIPGSVTAIGSQAFKGCSNLNTLEISTGLTGIGSYAFDGCTSLRNVSIPDSVTSIGDKAFEKCENLTTVRYGGTLAQWCAQVFDYNLMSYAKSVILVGENDLDLKAVTTLTIPEGVTSIESTAFPWCTSLANVVIPTSVTKINISAFYECKNLATVQYGGTLAQWCALDGNGGIMLYAKHVYMSDGTDLNSSDKLVIPDGVTSIGNGVFYECTGFSSVAIPTSVKSIGGVAFSGCTNLKSVIIPNSVTSIGLGAFSRCTGLTSVTISGSVASIEMMTFWNCTSLTDVTIYEGVTSIEDSAFSGCKNITNLTIPKGVKSIGDSAFSVCSGLTSVDIPASVTKIGKNAFSGTNLGTLKYDGTKEQWDGIEKGADIFSWTKAPTITGKDENGNEATWKAQ